MSIEIDSVPGTEEAVYATSLVTAKILQVEGTSEALSYVVGRKAAEYAGHVTMMALKNMGLIDESFDQEVFKQQVSNIRDQIVFDIITRETGIGE